MVSLSHRGALLCEGSEEVGYLYVSTEDVRVSVITQRLQKSSPPIGGTFRIHLASIVISGNIRCEYRSWIPFAASQVKMREQMSLGNAQGTDWQAKCIVIVAPLQPDVLQERS